MTTTWRPGDGPNTHRRPGYWDLLREGWSLFFSVLPRWIGVGLPLLLLADVLQAGVPPENHVRAVALAVPVSLLPAFANAGLFLLVWDELRGETVSQAETWGTVARRIITIWLISLASIALTLVGLLLLLVPGVWIGVRLGFAQIAATLVPDEAMALERSWKLTSGRFWWTAGLFLSLGLASMCLMAPGMILQSFSSGALARAATGVLISLAAGPMMAALVVAFAAIRSEQEWVPAGWHPAEHTGDPMKRPAGAPPGASAGREDDPAPPPPADEELPHGGAPAPFE